jgi:hypothetical protein
MSYITQLTCIVSVFVIVLQLMEFFVSYSRVVYGNVDVKNSIICWMVVHFGFLLTYLLTRGMLIVLFCLFIFIFSPSLLVLGVCLILLFVYLYLLSK